MVLWIYIGLEGRLLHINESAGIFYDMIYYNLIYFNRKSIDLRYQSFYYDRETIFYKGIMPSEVGFRFSSGL